ncbi:MAG: FHA domain-containing protein [Chloroflexaceae bacterium]|nr:FHA domain-containing protein [Chloroflexaceae bacterium]NJO06604.1 FHA domain-containing protein [Chloroflexaceae bacterium]
MFDFATLSINAVILVLRVLVVVLLYFFLWQVLRVITTDLRRGVVAPGTEPAPYGQLVVMSSGQTGLPVGKAFPLKPLTIIGRSLESDIALNDTFLSGEHARLELRPNGWILEDLNSTNGTFVNGLEVRDATPLNNGDVVRIGRIELRLTG